MCVCVCVCVLCCVCVSVCVCVCVCVYNPPVRGHQITQSTYPQPHGSLEYGHQVQQDMPTQLWQYWTCAVKKNENAVLHKHGEKLAAMAV